MVESRREWKYRGDLLLKDSLGPASKWFGRRQSCCGCATRGCGRWSLKMTRDEGERSVVGFLELGRDWVERLVWEQSWGKRDCSLQCYICATCTAGLGWWV